MGEIRGKIDKDLQFYDLKRCRKRRVGVLCPHTAHAFIYGGAGNVGIGGCCAPHRAHVHFINGGAGGVSIGGWAQ